MILREFFKRVIYNIRENGKGYCYISDFNKFLKLEIN